MKKIIATLIAMFPLMGFAMCGNSNSVSGNTANASNSADSTFENVQNVNVSVVSIEEAIRLGWVKVVDNVIISENLPVVVDCYADWCGPCRQYSPIFHEIAENFGGQAYFIQLNTDNYPEICRKYDINAIPNTLFIMAGGGILGQKAGLMQGEELATLVTQLIYTSAGEDLGN